MDQQDINNRIIKLENKVAQLEKKDYTKYIAIGFFAIVGVYEVVSLIKSTQIYNQKISLLDKLIHMHSK